MRPNRPAQAPALNTRLCAERDCIPADWRCPTGGHVNETLLECARANAAACEICATRFEILIAGRDCCEARHEP